MMCEYFTMCLHFYKKLFVGLQPDRQGPLDRGSDKPQVR